MRRSRPPDDSPEGEPRAKHHRLEQSPLELPFTPQPGYVPSAITFQQPQQLLTFSYTPEHELEFTDSALRYFVDPPHNADLRYGYERWIKRPEEVARLDSLLRAVSRARSKMETQGNDGSEWLGGIGVVTWRGIITKILTAPYEDRDGWNLNVMFVNGTLYFEEYATDEELQKRQNLAPNHRLQTYYGYSFESYCTAASPVQTQQPGYAPGWGGDVNTNVQWCSIVKTKLADTRLVIGGEVDCVRDKYTGKPDTFVELKTSLSIRHAQDEVRFEKKLLKFYFQSFLLGVPEIVVGFRTTSGRLVTVQSFKTVEIPRLVRGKPGAWDPMKCLDWGKRLFAFLKSIATSHSQDTSIMQSDAPVWRVKFTPGTGVSVSILDRDELTEVTGGEDRVGFLPRWYWDEIDAKSTGPVVPQPTEAIPGESSSTSLPKGWQI